MEYVIFLLSAIWFSYASCKNLMLSTYCCIKSGEKHVLCQHPSKKPSESCVRYKNLLPDGDTNMIGVINMFREHVAAGLVENAATASSMNKLKSHWELKLIADILLRQCFLEQEPGFLLGYSLNSIHFPTVWFYFVQSERDRRFINPAQYLRSKLETNGGNSSKFVSPVTGIMEKGVQYGQMTSLLLDTALFAGCGSASFKTPKGTATDKPYYFTFLCILGPSNYNISGVFPYTKGDPKNSCDWMYNITDERYPHLCSISSALADSIYVLLSQVMVCLVRAYLSRL